MRLWTAQPELAASESFLAEEHSDFVHALALCGVDYLVVGAHAFAAHLGRRANGALEVMVRPSPENSIRVVRTLAVLDLGLERLGMTHYDFAYPGTVYDLGTAQRRVVLVTSISGVDFADAWQTRVAFPIQDGEAWVLGREHLSRHMQASGRSWQTHERRG